MVDIAAGMDLAMASATVVAMAADMYARLPVLVMCLAIEGSVCFRGSRPFMGLETRPRRYCYLKLLVHANLETSLKTAV